MPDLDKIKTIIVVMMENRSFDHLLGYRSLPPLNQDVNGQRDDPAWKKQFVNVEQRRTRSATVSKHGSVFLAAKFRSTAPANGCCRTPWRGK
jgi:phospholipase C